jgi:hypothetical protein
MGDKRGNKKKKKDRAAVMKEPTTPIVEAPVTVPKKTNTPRKK